VSGWSNLSGKPFRALLNENQFGKNDKTWFPRWMQRHAPAARMVHGSLSLIHAEVVELSQSLLAGKLQRFMRHGNRFRPCESGQHAFLQRGGKGPD
jgi:hypothetical protein